MAGSFPADAVGTAAGVICYTIICIMCSLFVFWLAWIHRERNSYVAFLSFFTFLSSGGSFIQQIHTVHDWEDIKRGQHAYLLANIDNPRIAVANASNGMDLVLFYIQYYGYNVSAMLVLFWAVELAWSVFRVRSRAPVVFGLQPAWGMIAKGIAVCLPIVQIVLLSSDVLLGSITAYLIVADFLMIFSLVCGSLLLLSILIKYIGARRALISWNVRYGRTTSTPNPTLGSNHGSSVPGMNSMPKNIYDRWLVIRFTIAFIVLGVFQLLIVLFQISAAANNKAANIPAEPSLGAEQAKRDMRVFPSGASGSMLVFVVFGTTRTFRDWMWNNMVPESLRTKLSARTARKGRPSVVYRASQKPPSSVAPSASPSDGSYPSYEATCSHAPNEIFLQDVKQSSSTQHKVKEDDELPILIRTQKLANHRP